MARRVHAPPTGELAIVFCDVQDARVLWDRAAHSMQAALELYQRLMREVISDLGAYEVRTKGDAFMIAAPDATLALRLCFEAQRRLLECPWPGAIMQQPSGAVVETEDGAPLFRGLRVRMGIHAGRPRCKPDPMTGRMDYVGGMVNRAARVADAAHGGQILLTHAAFEALDEGVDAHWRDLGVHRLRGLRREEHLRQALSIPLAARRFPPVRTFGLRHAAMPVTDHEFFGRSAELEQIRRTLHLEAGAVVVLAAGGMGKTRFALRFAELYGDEFDGGVWFCDLSAAQTLEGLLREVARALGLALVGASVEPQIEQIGFALAGREEALFLFDNVEQVARELAAVLPHWLKQTPEARYLITSQRAIAGEDIVEFELPTLDQEAAYELFVRRAQLVDPKFSADERQAKRIHRLIERLQRIPLAIAMAASRVDVFSLSRLEKRLGASFAALSPGSSKAERVDQTLSHLGDWSWSLLPDWACEILMQCATFVGGFNLAQAKGVIDLSNFPESPPVEEALETLCSQSLLYRAMAPELRSEQRYGLYGVVYAQAKQALQSSGSVDAVMERHAQVYLELAERLSALVSGPDGLDAINRLAADLNNILVVHKRFEELRPIWAARATNSLMPLLIQRGPILLAVELLEDGAAARERLPAAQRLKGLAWRCEVRRLVGQNPGAQADAEEMLRLAKALDDEQAIAGAWSRLAVIDRELGERTRAKRRMRRAQRAVETLGDDALHARILNNLAVFEIEQGKPLQAEVLQRRALDLLRQVGDHQREWSIWCNLGTMRMDHGDLHEADEHYNQALSLALGLGQIEAQALVLSNMGTLYWRLGQRDQAEGLYTRALVLLRSSGSRRAEGYILAMLGGLTGDQGLEEQARLRLERAGAILNELRDPIGPRLVHLAHAFVDLAQVRRAHGEGDLPASKRAKARADKRRKEIKKPIAPGGPSPVEVSDDVRSLLTLLERSVAELPRLKPGVVGGAAAIRRWVPWEEELVAEDTAVDGESLADDYDA
ncbi:MAG: adenylate/guanylate cyclase domain-containing protein [Myxococcota bacterium]|nr:adenylate/guanylate cyclase domain-containing protein [Myxococcota bacterium]